MDNSIFTVKVLVAWGEPNIPIQQYEEQYTITCTKDATGTNNTDDVDVEDGWVV